MTSRMISSFASEKLSDVQTGSRIVLYEELAEYYYLFTRSHSLQHSTVNFEVNYHIGNIALLSLYFDVVLIQTAAIFNSKDPFVRKIAKRVIEHPKLREMIDYNVVKIVGWGGNSPKEMFQAAKSFSIDANPQCMDEEYYSAVASIFNSQSVISRSESTPDEGIEVLFRRRLEQTTVIRRENELKEINDAVDRSLEQVGQLVAVSFHPELAKLRLHSSSVSSVGISFIQSWYDNLETEIPGVSVYAPMTNIQYLDQQSGSGDAKIRTFLYSPQIFGSFLSGYLSQADFEKILHRPYAELAFVKNGDWKRFCDAYHAAVIQVSKEIGHLGRTNLSEEQFSDSDRWANQLINFISEDANRIDVNAFLEGLATLSGVVFSIPCLGPSVKTVGHLFGERLSDIFQAFCTKASSDVSPFIQKLIRHYELSGARA